MHLLTSRWKLLGVIAGILITGFVVVNFANYYVSSQSIYSALVNNELPLTSNNIYSEIQASLLRPIYISSLMANDTFLKDWMIDGEQDITKISKYLAEIRNRYNVSSAFVVSNNSHKYYYHKGILKIISENVPKDSWFFSMEAHPDDYRVDVDANEANRNNLTIFVNHKLYDYKGDFLGVTGLGLDMVSVGELIERYKQDFRRNIYFVDRSGQIKSHTDQSLIDHMNIRFMEGIGTVAEELLNNDNGFLLYDLHNDNMLLSYRYIKELDWFLLVEQPKSEALRPIRQALILNLAISAGITLIVLLISGFAAHRFHHSLEALAKIDKLTGLYNRQYFDALYLQAINNVGRHTETLALALFDIDNLKQINDRLGHLEGDKLLQSVALQVKKHMRKSDAVARWGGDEFVILFQDCNASSAIALMDRIRQDIQNTLNQSNDETAISISVGVAEYAKGDTTETLLTRADERLYQAKNTGRNKVIGT